MLIKPTLFSSLSKTLKFSALSLLSASPFSSRRHQKPNDDDDDGGSGSFSFHGGSEHPPRLLVVQPRLRSDARLQSKLSEALNLAKSLEEQRDDGFDAEDFASKETPPHLVVQHPTSRSIKAGELDENF